jgi:hypothetical protein
MGLGAIAIDLLPCCSPARGSRFRYGLGFVNFVTKKMCCHRELYCMYSVSYLYCFYADSDVCALSKRRHNYNEDLFQQRELDQHSGTLFVIQKR